MGPPSPAIRNLAQRLLALEAGPGTTSPLGDDGAARVSEKLRASLTRVAGADGFTSLFRRAVALARAEVPLLRGVRVKTDGSLEKPDEAPANEYALTTEAAVAVTAHLLGLLATFIGEPLMLRLVRESWPDATLEP